MTVCLDVEQAALSSEREAFIETRDRLEAELAGRLVAQERATEQTVQMFQQSQQAANAEISGLVNDLERLAASHHDQMASLVAR